MRFAYPPLKATAAADGTAQVDFTPRGAVDLVILKTFISVVMPDPASLTQAAATALLNGQLVDVTDAGNRDVSPDRYLLRSGDVYSIRWTGCDPGAACTASITGEQYPFGQGPPE